MYVQNNCLKKWDKDDTLKAEEYFQPLIFFIGGYNHEKDEYWR